MANTALSPSPAAPVVVPPDERATAALRYAEIRLAVEHARHAADVAQTELAAVAEQCQQVEDAMLDKLVTLGAAGALHHALAFGDAAGLVLAARHRSEQAQGRLAGLLQDEQLALEALAASCSLR